METLNERAIYLFNKIQEYEIFVMSDIGRLMVTFQREGLPKAYVDLQKIKQGSWKDFNEWFEKFLDHYLFKVVPRELKDIQRAQKEFSAYIEFNYKLHIKET